MRLIPFASWLVACVPIEPQDCADPAAPCTSPLGVSVGDTVVFSAAPAAVMPDTLHVDRLVQCDGTTSGFDYRRTTTLWSIRSVDRASFAEGFVYGEVPVGADEEVAPVEALAPDVYYLAEALNDVIDPAQVVPVGWRVWFRSGAEPIVASVDDFACPP